MIRDARSLEEGSAIDCDICVVGAGAAGITLARQLDNTSIAVTVLESGGLEQSEENQALYRGRVAGHSYFPLDRARLRFFGGTTNHWGGLCRPLDAIDFEQRAWIPDSGWPIDRSILDPFYRRAHEICQLGDFDYHATSWEPHARPAVPFPSTAFDTGVFQFSAPTRFGQVYRDDLSRSGNVTVLLHANVVELSASDPPNMVKAVQVRCLEGPRFTVRARVYVLATGAIENARLLLASNNVGKAGLGNDHDLVGRYFMDHLLLARAGRVVTEADTFAPFYAELNPRPRGRTARSVLLLSPLLQRREQLSNYSAMFHPALMNRGVQSMRYLFGRWRSGNSLDDLGHHVWNVIQDLDDVVQDAYQDLVDPSARPQFLAVYNLWEQVPNRDSRVSLTSERDALGLPRVALDWRLSEFDRRTVQRALGLLASDLGRNGYGRMQLPDWDEMWPDAVTGDWHQMGTTRMHNDPRRGVVDRDCRVHGVDNLYIAGSSVFPTGGSATPTLTIVALALRLADHLILKPVRQR